MNSCSKRRCSGTPRRGIAPWRDKVFITRSAPEVAFVTWHIRKFPCVERIQEDAGLVCDRCGDRLDWEPFAVIDLPSEEELQDPEYVPVGGTALCKACAMRFYHLRQQDVGKVDRVWLCYGCAQHTTR